MTRPRTTLAVAIALGALAAPAGSGASSWPSRTVSYADHTQLHRVVRAAVRAWNAATTGLHLVRVGRGRGQVRIIQRRSPYLHGFGFYPPDGRATVFADGPDDPSNQTLVAVVMHEIGHAVGLGHVTGRCAVMNPVVLFERACARARRRLGLRGKLCGAQTADARALVRLYGGRVRARRFFGVCPIPVPAPPAAPAGRLLGPSGSVVVPDSAGVEQPVHAVVTVRNTGRWTWGRAGRWTCCGRRTRLSREDVSLVLVDARGRPLAYQGCARPLSHVARSDAARPVAPGGAGRFAIELCSYAVPALLRLRLDSFSDGGRREGPVFTVRVRRDAAPEAAITSSSAGGPVAPGTVVSFRDASSDDGGIARRAWDFGDPASGVANTSSAAAPTHRYAAAGYYAVALTVTDSAGQSSQANAEVYVEEPAPPES